MPKNPNRIDVYMPPAERGRLLRVAAKLERQGESVRDNRGNISLSAVIRLLVKRADA